MQAWCDGAFDHASGVAAYGVVLRDDAGRLVETAAELVYPAPGHSRLQNNEAEWIAAGVACWLLGRYPEPCTLRGDATTADIRKAVEAAVGHPVPPSSIRSYLRLNSDKGGRFIQSGRGRYRLRKT